MTVKFAQTATLDVAYEEAGPPDGAPVFLMHGFPDDARVYDGVVEPVAGAGHRVIVPYLRGYGPTRFRDPETMRSGQQAALGADLRDLMDALGIERAVLGGYDWGGRAACIVAALWPERVAGLVSVGGYNIQDIARATTPADPETERRNWYQWYFNTERGRAGLAANRHGICRLCWQLWSPTAPSDETVFARTAASFDNPDFVDVVIHSYRHRYDAVPGDTAFADIEARLAAQPSIVVPTIALEGADDGFGPPEQDDPDRARFEGPYERRIIPGAGHFLPRDRPEAMVRAILDLRDGTRPIGRAGAAP